MKPLKFVFPRLFQLSANKDVFIGESGKWVNGSWVWDLKWRREFFDRVSEAANELLSIISNFAPNAGCADGWTWIASPDGQYSTKSAYIKATRNETTMSIINKETLARVWDTPAPQKAIVTTWRILRNRLSTCDNLRKRNVPLGEEELKCNACIHQKETTNHFFLLCPKI
ncbi:uncharacterized protein LOC131018781 [Salvia miltiorrhiza]|uniref:uncharacterized protein LOC131018781 n=1 Tax=Salvia miltiorrhiza TaxID=226208 RepID=UPI0025AD4007|nr:uncharacterized protein LOC131018781 [Salvia miltiorrhiza]